MGFAVTGAAVHDGSTSQCDDLINQSDLKVPTPTLNPTTSTQITQQHRL
ncbi:uncharacterized protein G2W53_006334 [Senna tora]|uniref:Uncharacterized protein n=1 Tax=Senna tora TaxID=362788 RepID=A0A834X547_9FABA|nr:uncharacterized protein G2W53_006334 [Senna tora]